ncbi:unnamed protein product [Nippostrongylus brasiliensis]|uniref:DNA-directed RNA polymerase subunit n=1 Tax=Nippostrongylus brasiliensis TaxID=27835 RepID=A0A158QY08_NIPBR|nr:unnamed protein product [Nippostrongylus brasiliensis]
MTSASALVYFRKSIVRCVTAFIELQDDGRSAVLRAGFDHENQFRIVICSRVGVKLCAGSSKFIRRSAHMQVLHDRLYECESGPFVPARCGPLDQRLGPTAKTELCFTCHQNQVDCVGHFGYVDLALPVFHIGYFKLTIKTLQCICKRCSALLLSGADRAHFQAQISNRNLNYVHRKALHERLVSKCRKTRICPRCGSTNGHDHERFDCDTVAKGSAEPPEYTLRPKFTLLNPIQVRKLFRNVPYEDIPILMVCSGEMKHPNDLLLTRIPVPPTSKNKKEGAPVKVIMELWEHLQVRNFCPRRKQCKRIAVALFFNGEIAGLQPEFRPKKPVRGLAQRLKGKHGRFRGNLSGKRVDFSARTVISPDPNLRIDEVGVPAEIACSLTFPEIVNALNLENMKKLVIAGPDNHPGANFVVDRKTGKKFSLKFCNRQLCAEKLKIGDIVERQIGNGDLVLFNRQPFNECVCTPYNADFDGDEMNLHVPQTLEAKAEADILMGVRSNLCTPRSGELVIGAIQDFITAMYVMTHKDTFFTLSEMCQLSASVIEYSSSRQTRIHLPPPSILKPTALWSGKQLVQLMISGDWKDSIKVNMSVPNRYYTTDRELCVKDSFVVIRNGQLLCGTLDKVMLGTGSKTNIFHTLLCDFGENAAVNAVFLTNRGFSLGIGDVQPKLELREKVAELFGKGYKKCQDHIGQHRRGKLKAQPGCSAEETLEALILHELSSVRDHAGKASNSALIMAVSGSKGSYLNISQMIACVGQQAISGRRPPDGFFKRSLPHFERFQKTPEAKGFVENSFFSGLSPTEFFFHSMAGREGLVDTAVKTAETGYMQRRLVKSLEDLCCHYDGTIRTSAGEIVEFFFGEDNIDPSRSEADDGFLVNLDHEMDHVRNTIPFSDDHQLQPKEVEALIRSILDEEIVSFHSELRKRVESFVNNAVAKTLMFERAVIEPGAPVGAITATSIGRRLCFFSFWDWSAVLESGILGEPSTQMTLKTFHFAGVASMNVTQGVPRLKEIINAVRAICDYIEEVITKDRVFLLIKLSARRIRQLNLEITMFTVVQSIIAGKGSVRIKQQQIRILGKSMMMIWPSSNPRYNAPVVLQIMKQTLRKVIVKGLPNVRRCVVRNDDGAGFSIVVEGDDLRGVLSQVGIDGRHTRCNNAVVVAGILIGKTSRNLHLKLFSVVQVLGIEAARSCIVSEILSTMQAHGIVMDGRHVMLLADLMTHRGEVIGITRNGLAKLKDSVLLLASFEKTVDHLYEAAFSSQKDHIRGVSESIIIGSPIPVGTGMFKLLQKVPRGKLSPRKPIFLKSEFGLKI